MHKITIVKRTDDYMAYADNNKGLWDVGKTITQAIGELVMTHPEYLGIEIEIKE